MPRSTDGNERSRWPRLVQCLGCPIDSLRLGTPNWCLWDTSDDQSLLNTSIWLMSCEPRVHDLGSRHLKPPSSPKLKHLWGPTSSTEGVSFRERPSGAEGVAASVLLLRLLRVLVSCQGLEGIIGKVELGFGALRFGGIVLRTFGFRTLKACVEAVEVSRASKRHCICPFQLSVPVF